MAAQRVLFQLVFYQSAQPVIGLAHIRRPGAQPDASLLAGDKHQPWLSLSSMPLPSLNTMCQPLGDVGPIEDRSMNEGSGETWGTESTSLVSLRRLRHWQKLA